MGGLLRRVSGIRTITRSTRGEQPSFCWPRQASMPSKRRPFGDCRSSWREAVTIRAAHPSWQLDMMSMEGPMLRITNGLVAGFAATVVLSALMIAKSMMGLMPGLDVIHMLAGMMGAPTVAGWFAHFVIGIVAWGVGFALIHDLIPGNGSVLKGMVFATGAWLAMMIVVMPMAGAGLFGYHLGIMAPVMTLVLHWVYGAVLGGVYQMRAQGHSLVH